MRTTVGIAVLLVALTGCQAQRAPEQPSEPAPSPPAMESPAATDQRMAWYCDDDSRFETWFDEARDVLYLEYAGVTRELEAAHRAAKAAWSDGEVRFASGSAGVELHWAGDVVHCERAPVGSSNPQSGWSDQRWARPAA